MRIKPSHWVVLLLALVAIGSQLIKYIDRWSKATTSVESDRDQLQLGQVTLQSCTIGTATQASLQAYCTEFEVPENHADAHADHQGRRIKLKVAIVKSEAAKPGDDLVTFLDGGPGGAATDDYPAIAGAFAPVRRQHHVLLVDQRGTGGSNALDCPQLDATTYKQSADQLGQLTNDKAKMHSLLRDCLAEIRSKADPQFYSTTDAVHDLEAVRRALGNPKLNLVGVSYGTRVAQQYAARFPEGVRSIVLDSPVPNSLALGQEHARNLEEALKAQFALCRAQAECRQRFGDSYAQLKILQARLRAQPATAQVADPNTFHLSERALTPERLAGLVRLYTYNGYTSALMPLMIDEALKGNYAPLLGQEQLVTSDMSSRMTGGMGLSVGCSEDADLLTSNEADRDTLMGNIMIEFFQTACAIWPHRARPADFHQPFKSALPVLILTGELDPVTPPRYGTEILSALSNARLLNAPGQGHGILMVRCVPELVGEFVKTLNGKALDAKCLEKLHAPPAFLNYNGAAP